MDVTWHFYESWDFWVAFGTILLALVTGGLAFGTFRTARDTRRLAELTELEVAAVKDQAVAAREEVETSRAALQTSVQPVLADVPLGVFVERVSKRDEPARRTLLDHAYVRFHRAEDERYVCSVPLRNAGTGIALIRKAVLRPPDSVLSWEGTPSGTVVSPRELVHIEFPIDESDPRQQEAAERSGTAGAFSVEVSYTDISGGQPMRTLAEVRRVPSSGEIDFDDELWAERYRGSLYRVHRVLLFRGTDIEPFAVSGAESDVGADVQAV
jgi:hypothetical protein